MAAILGSRSSDVLSGLGLPPVLRSGDRLRVGRSELPVPGVDVAPVPTLPAGEVVLRVSPGPRADWFVSDAVDLLVGSEWEVTSRSNRVGLRLAGPEIERAGSGELPSEGMVTGAIQVPPSRQPVLFLADHPTTGGYPVIAVVRSVDLPRAAQAGPGDRIRFLKVKPDQYGLLSDL